MPQNDALAPVETNSRRLPGRDPEISALKALLAEARQTRTIRVALIRGAEGVGRTALLSELGRLWTDEGVLVALTRGPADVVRQLSAALTTAGSSLEAIGRERPVAWLVDDCDELDVEGQKVLAGLLPTLTRPAALRASDETLQGGVIVLATGEKPFSSALSAVLDRLQPVQQVLAPFDAEGLRRYLTQTGLTERLLEATGGVPARLEELLAAPRTVDLATRRIARLPAGDRDLLAALAVLARPESARFISAVSATHGVLDRLKSLVDSGWVAPSPDLGKTHYALARESDRRALLTDFPADRLQLLRRAAGEQYIAAGQDEAAFRSFHSAGEQGRAFELGLRVCDRQVAQRSLAAAEETLNLLAGSPLSREQRRFVYLRLADVLEARVETRGALAAVGRARAATDPSGRGALRARAARLCIALGASAPAERLARKVLETEPLSGDACIAFAEARFLRGAYEEAIQFVDGQARLPATVRVALENVRGKALLTLGRLPEARAVFQANATRATDAGLSVEQVRALLNVGVVAHRQGAREEARQAYATALAAGDVPFTPVVRANLASLHFEEGDVEQAIAEAHRAVAAFVGVGRAKEESHATQNLARFYLFAGDLKRALEIARHAGDLAARIGDPYLVAGARLVAAEVSLRRGEPGAQAALSDVADAFERLGNPRYRSEALLLKVEGQLAARDGDAARATLTGTVVTSHPALVPEWHLLKAESALLSGSDAEAAESLRLAREGLVAAPHVELPARLHALTAQVAERRGEVAVAQSERLKALNLLERLASRVPMDLRGLFFARPSRRAIVEQAGRLLPDAPRPMPVALPAQTVALVGRAQSIVRINQLIDRIGSSTATVLIRGESGTGKELVARALHERSPRRELPLVAVNCGALSEELLLSELFGHERGAFTGAIRDRKGRFELAEGGTIFLDEIGDISPRAQVALLRVLQEKTFERVGGTRTLSADVRVVCATNRPLEELMKKGQFREDLYYRLRGTTLTLPPLREHIDDLPELCATHLARLAQERGEPSVRRLSREVVGMLERHAWPGNVRELFHLLESVSLLASGETIEPDAFELYPELFPAADAPRPIRIARTTEGAQAVDFYDVLKQRDLSLKDFRRELDLACISQALQEASGNISEAARLLKMKRSRLSQVVNAEPTLRVLCRSPLNETTGEEGDEEDGPILALEARRRNGAVE